MNLIYKLFLTINSTLLVVVIYGIKKEWSVSVLPSWISGIILLLIPIILSAISIPFTLLLGKDNLATFQDIQPYDD